ncbi:MAG TPA: hypothetical protein VL992_05730 [Tepidisphaeraceae bacterium]|nr:hypothetical protein [Tepidisphaeraceae bacterium]
MTVRFRKSIFAILLIALTAAARAADLIPINQMPPLYAAALGPLYHPEDLNQLYSAHLLLEHYFAATTEVQRHDIVQQLRATNIAAAILGRIARLRLSWQNIPPGVYYINEKSGPFTLRYFLGIPRKYRRDVAWPLVVKLPTANAFVTDPPPSADEVVQIYTGWINDELSQHPDALVLMPLLNLKELYGPSYAGMNSVYRPIRDVANRCNVDPARVYLIGHSMAAHGVWNIALHYPTYFAAINPLAGAANADWQRLRLINLRNVLPVVWADTADTIVPSTESAQIVSVLRQRKIDVDYTQTDGVGHIPPPEILNADYLKLRARIRPLYPRHISMQSNRPDSIFNRIDWVQVYQELDAGADETLQLQWGTGRLTFSDNAYTLDAILDHNTVQMATDNVADLRLYFNDQMVDMSKPVTVIINGRTRFSGLLTPDLDGMLKDQLFLGRGWRYFTVSVDLDLTSSPPPQANASSTAGPTTQPHHGRIVIYNDDGSVRQIIETP